MNIDSSILRNDARTLRKQGISFRDVAASLSLPLSTIHLWTKDIHLTNKQEEVIKKKHRQRIIIARTKVAHEKKEERLLLEQNEYNLAKSQIKFDMRNDSFFLFGLALYWSEGFKKDHSLGFVNSDPTMIRIFLQWLIIYGNIHIDNVRLRIQIHEMYKEDIEKITSYWSNLLRIPINQFQNPFFQQSRTVYLHKDESYKGLLRIRVIKSRKLFIKILGWLDGVKASTVSI